MEGEYCHIQGMPHKGWISEAGDVLVIYLNKTGGRDACDHPEDWMVERLPANAGVK